MIYPTPSFLNLILAGPRPGKYIGPGNWHGVEFAGRSTLSESLVLVENRGTTPATVRFLNAQQADGLYSATNVWLNSQGAAASSVTVQPAALIEVNTQVSVIHGESDRLTVNEVPADGDTITIGDGTTTITYEFDDDGSVSGGNVAIDLNDTSGPGDVARAIHLALQASIDGGSATEFRSMYSPRTKDRVDLFLTDPASTSTVTVTVATAGDIVRTSRALEGNPVAAGPYYRVFLENESDAVRVGFASWVHDFNLLT